MTFTLVSTPFAWVDSSQPTAFGHDTVDDSGARWMLLDDEVARVSALHAAAARTLMFARRPYAA